MTNKQIIEAAVGVVLFGVCLVGYVFSRKKITGEALTKKQKRVKKLWFAGMLAFGWFTGGVLITAFSGKHGHLAIDFEMFSERIQLPLLPFTVAKTTVIGWGVMLVLILLMALFRLLAVPKFKADSPGGLQNAMEVMVEALDNFVASATNAGTLGSLAPYMMSVALYMLGCAFAELFGLRAPTSDLTFTFSLGLCTLGLINIYGIRENGFVGRLKNLGGPVPWMRPVMIPLKMIGDLAVPISLSCRLFGNMIGGLLVMDLLKGVLGGYGIGLPAVAGIYFNLIHPLLQIYIFVTLSLTYINEAMELEEPEPKEKKPKKLKKRS